MTDLVIETRGLSKRYGSRAAVDGIDITVPRGVVAGFVGPNGAGKTTTMAMLLGLVAPTSGTGSVLGGPLSKPASYLPRTGALIEYPAFYSGLSGEENLGVLATIGGYDQRHIAGLLELVGLAARGGDPYRAYSMGMKQRLGIAAALLGDPELLILDEPTNGLDPAGIHEMRGLIGSLRDGRRTVFVSSHVLAELEQVCDWYVVIDHGAVVFQGPASQLMDGTGTRIVLVPERDAERERLCRLVQAKGFQVEANGRGLVVDINGAEPRHAGAAINRAAIADGVVLAELRVERKSLEERYLGMVRGGDR